MSIKSILFSAAKSIIAPFNSNAAAPERMESDLGSTFWWRGNEIVRVVWVDGTKEWYRDGELHREGSPAIERPSGTREWHRDGQLHREDGPAIEHADGRTRWYVFGRELSEAQFNELRDRSLAALPARPAPGSQSASLTSPAPNS